MFVLVLVIAVRYEGFTLVAATRHSRCALQLLCDSQTLRQYPAIHPITCFTTVSLYNVVIYFDTVVRQERNIRRKIMNSTVSPSRYIGMRHRGVGATWPICPAYTMVRNVKIDLSECPYYCCIHLQNSLVVTDMPPGTDCPYPIRILAFFEMIRPYHVVIRI